MAEDACAILEQLRKARLDLLTGQSRVRVVIANGIDVTYSNVEMAALERAIAQYDAACAQQQGQLPRRYAFRAGAMTYQK
jgi:hypothetical protein